MLSLLVVLSSCLAFSYAETRSYKLELTNKFIQPDGFNRTSVLANNQFPAPLLRAKKGDNLEVLVVNKLTDSSMAQGASIHWHGLFQRRTAAQDGTAWISQCPISPGESFQYRFNVGNQAGTFWYHSHVTAQYCDGLRGPLIIYDDSDIYKHLYDVDDASTVINLGDWYHLPSPESFRNLELPPTTVINGLGRYKGGPKSPLAVVNVQRNTRYRFRIINAACLSAFNFAIDKHSFTIIEIDGVATLPHKVDIIEIHAGQRVSAIVETNRPVDNYWIRSTPFFAGYVPVDDEDVNSAILRYKGAKNAEPTSKPVPGKLLREQDLMPLALPHILPRKPDVAITLNMALDPSGQFFTINGKKYHPPTVPVLLQIMNGTDPRSLMPSDNIITLPRNKLIEVSIPGGAPLGPHPFHLHGHTFEVVRSAGTNKYNYFNPPIRDVVNTGVVGDNTTFRFVTDNPGPWMLHCHIEWHIEPGLAVIFAEDPQGQVSGPKSQQTPKDWQQLCPKWEALKSGKQYSVTLLE